MDRFITKKPNQSNDGACSKSAQLPECFSEEDNNNDDCCSDANEKKQNAKRKFRSEWLKTFDCLREKDGAAFFCACSKQLISYCGHLKAHEKCIAHAQSYESQKKQFTMEKFYNAKQVKSQQKVINAEFAIIMFCITHNLPLLLMDYLPALLVECCPDSSIVDYIAKQASQHVISALRNKKFSLFFDETTDVSMVKTLLLVARYVDSDRVVDRFIALLELTKADASSIFNVIKKFISTRDNPLKNLIGLTTDGANVMAGDLGGLKALLSAEIDLFYIKCTCHSLHLSSSYACKYLPKNIEPLCRNIYSFFSHSPKRIHELKEFQDYCPVKPHTILGWLSLEGVPLSIVEHWDCLKLYFVSCFSEVNGVRSAKLAEGMSCKIKWYFLFLSYILPITLCYKIEIYTLLK